MKMNVVSTHEHEIGRMLGIQRPATEETLQSIDSTLKRIEVIRCQKNHTSLEALKAAFAGQHHSMAPKLRVTIGDQLLFERRNEQKNQSH